MAWLEVHQTLPRHRKTFHLAAELKIPRVQVVGHMVSLWLWAIDNAPSGELTGLPAGVIAFAAEWEGDADLFVGALIRSGFIAAEDDEMVIHDWYEYAGKLIERREAERVRSANRRQSGTQPQDDPPTTGGQPPVGHRSTDGTVHNSTEQHSTEEDMHVAPVGAVHVLPAPRKNVRELYSGAFEQGWSYYPRKLNKHGAWIQWQARVRGGEREDRLIATCMHLTQYVDREGIEDRYVPHGSTFFGPQRKYLDFVDGMPEPRRRSASKGMGDLFAAYQQREQSA
jgi:hypothetical protein